MTGDWDNRCELGLLGKLETSLGLFVGNGDYIYHSCLKFTLEKDVLLNSSLIPSTYLD